jgi:signal transduction histidine kinase
MSDVRSAIHRAWLFLGLVGAVAVIAGLILAAFLARWITRPLRAAGSAARVIADGDMDARVPESGPPEVQELARDLNVMAGRLSARVRADREFAANAAHQLRTPLAALRLSLEEARDGPDARAEVVHALDEADRLSHIVDSLLELARERERTLEAVDLVTMTREIADRRKDDSGPAIRVTGVGVAAANPQRVSQVVSNLLDNACRYARSQVRVAVSPESSDRIVLRVDDDGEGIPEDDCARVFERFHRGTSPRGRGSGLGLAVARELAEADGASIAVVTSDLGGAGFELRYPAAAAVPVH